MGLRYVMVCMCMLYQAYIQCADPVVPERDDDSVWCEWRNKQCYTKWFHGKVVTGKQACLDQCLADPQCKTLVYNKQTDTCKVRNIWARCDGLIDSINETTITKLGDDKTCVFPSCQGKQYKYCRRANRSCSMRSYNTPDWDTLSSKYDDIPEALCQYFCNQDCKCLFYTWIVNGRKRSCRLYDKVCDKQEILVANMTQYYRADIDENCDKYKTPCNDRTYTYVHKDNVACESETIGTVEVADQNECMTLCSNNCPCKSVILRNDTNHCDNCDNSKLKCLLKSGTCTDAQLLVEHGSHYYERKDMGSIYEATGDPDPPMVDTKDKPCYCKVMVSDDQVKSKDFAGNVTSVPLVTSSNWHHFLALETTENDEYCALNVEVYVEPSQPTWETMEGVVVDTEKTRISGIRFSGKDPDDFFGLHYYDNDIKLFSDGQGFIRLYSEFTDDRLDRDEDDDTGHRLRFGEAIAVPVNSEPFDVIRGMSGGEHVMIKGPIPKVQRLADGSFVFDGTRCGWTVTFNRNEVHAVIANYVRHRRGIQSLCGECKKP